MSTDNNAVVPAANDRAKRLRVMENILQANPNKGEGRRGRAAKSAICQEEIIQFSYYGHEWLESGLQTHRWKRQRDVDAYAVLYTRMTSVYKRRNL